MTRSDEPTRLANVIMNLFRDQSVATKQVVADEGSTVDLIAGADAQDDCAVFRMSGDQELVVGSDYVRGPKFRLYEMGHLTEYDLGYYLAAANVSDIAAMGAHPIGLLSVVRYPADMSDETFESIMQGIKDACRRFRCPNIGGDIGSAERLILSATALGTCRRGGALFRSGAKPGDLVCVTAPTGFAGAAMEYLRAQRPDPAIDELHLATLLASWRRPSARVDEGIALAACGRVTSCQDTSDGLKATVECLAAASGVGITIFEDSVPLPEPVAAVAHHLRLDPLGLVFGDSVDFELAFTAPPDAVEQLRQEMALHAIGEVTDSGSAVMLGSNGELTSLPGKAWRHVPDQAGR
ncbi:thiamine-phosphate kinase [Lentzea jiangxiensis]|uniref:Thiamine-monophosphate kinase n=1 Tax=Lentzea jiangxiensis TaxID=641025 RepID=A0A1H0NTG3_9PSEU|nr:thiamine-phosphate kinase [Lentzea jiangxiensis]SDO95808.1 thiamine-monophosphate kinase [Lentzea jiangxiensis]